MADKPKVTSAEVAAAEPGLGSILTPGSDFAKVLHDQNGAQYAFWKTTDANLPGVKDGTGYSLWQFINDAVDNGWINATDTSNFEKGLHKTDWYKANGAQALQAAADKALSLDANGNVLPNSKYGMELQRRIDGVTANATAAGFKISPEIAKSLAEGTLMDAYDTNIYNSADYQAGLANKITAAAQSAGIALTGGSGAQSGIGLVNQLKAYAADMGVKMPDSFYTDAGYKMSDPKSGMTYDNFATNIKNYSISNYSGFTGRINQGETIKNIAAPYTQEFQNILGVPADSIDLTANTGDSLAIQKALKGNIDPATGLGTPMPIWQFQQTLRQDPRWNSTPDAQNSMASIVENLGRMFGKI